MEVYMQKNVCRLKARERECQTSSSACIRGTCGKIRRSGLLRQRKGDPGCVIMRHCDPAWSSSRGSVQLISKVSIYDTGQEVCLSSLTRDKIDTSQFVHLRCATWRNGTDLY